MSKEIRSGDLITIAGILRDGVMDETRSMDTANIQHWRVTKDDGRAMEPVTATGEADVESYWFGRRTWISSRGGVMSHATHHGRN